MGAHVVILGAGVGGQVAANALRRRLGREYRITVVERDVQHAFAPSFLWVMTGARTPGQVTSPLAKLLARGVNLHEGEVSAIDVAGRRVETSRGSLDYDFLVVALGAELAADAVPGLSGRSHSYYSLEGATRLKPALDALGNGAKVAVLVAGLPYKCPGAPHEGAMLIADYLRRRRRIDVSVDLFTPEPQPLPVAGPALGGAVAAMLQSRGVGFHPLHKVASIADRVLAFDNGASVPFDLLVAIPPHRSPSVVRTSGLANEAGWIPVDRRTLETRAEGVLAIGDITAVQIPGRWKPDVPLLLPKAGVFAHAQALVAAERVAAAALGQPCDATFCGDGFCMLEAGGGAAGVAYGDFFAEPAPEVRVRDIGVAWHLGKVLFEQWWLSPQGARRAVLGAALRAGSRLTGVPVRL